MVMDSTRLLPSRRPGGILSVLRAFERDVQWARGLVVIPRAIGAPFRVDPCPEDVDVDAEGPGAPVVFEAVTVRQGVVCSTLSNPTVAQDAADVVAITSGWALSRELIGDADNGTANPTLSSSATPLGVTDSLRDAVAALEEWADTTLHGAVAVIHVPIGLAAYVRASLDEAGTLRTVAGNIVVIHGTGNTVYASGELWGATTPTNADAAIDRKNNRAEGWADAVGIVVFDPATVASVTVNTTPSSV
jgi:hypothetical protein